MFTFLDLLIVVSVALIGASLLSVALMFLVKNEKVRRVCLWITAALGLYIGYVGFTINAMAFTAQATAAIVLALMGVAAVLLERLKKNNSNVFLTARIMGAVALLGGVANALLI